MNPLSPWVGMPILGFALGGLLQWVIVRSPSWVITDNNEAFPPSNAHWLPVAGANALLWWICANQWQAWSAAWPWAVFASLLLALAWIDWQTTLLPNILTLGLMSGGLIASAQAWIDTALDQSLIGASLGYGCLWITAFVFERITGKVGMGGGDFKLLAALGAWLGVGVLPVIVFIAALIGVLAAVLLREIGRAHV